MTNKNTIDFFLFNHIYSFGIRYLTKKTKAAAFEVYVSLNSLMLQSTLIWLFCYHSSLATVHMGHISIYAYSTPWYKLSIGSQKIIQLMIQRSNCRFGYSGFGILQCNLDTLKMVCTVHCQISNSCQSD